ncbi:amino acid kinase family protein [Legionella fallonii]|uniref:Uncharacterized protein n=1 Tax=Legionella fallonii LLAP-10 TaxID=1212491 RepID=A0A098G180_9GAMM|nr:hypothetical protein [Legionella fallonii]CEG56222.1 protein of unknown function [Legionella fallonii LLAP-10]
MGHFSATQGTTSILQTLLDSAKSKSSYRPLLEDLYLSHQDLIKALRLEHHSMNLIRSLEKDCNEIKDILHAVQLTNSYSKEIQDIILSYGEL